MKIFINKNAAIKSNIILGENEVAFELDEKKIKIGDGIKSYNKLQYANTKSVENMFLFIAQFLAFFSNDSEVLSYFSGNNISEAVGKGSDTAAQVKSKYESNADRNSVPLTGTTFGNSITGVLQFSGDGGKLYRNLPDEHQSYLAHDDKIIALIHDAVDSVITVGIGHDDNLIGIIKEDGEDVTGIIYDIVNNVAQILGIDLEITDPAKGIILTSPDLTRWRITVDNDGNLTTTEL